MTQHKRRIDRLEKISPLDWLSPSDLEGLSLDELRAIKEARERAKTIAFLQSMSRDPDFVLANRIAVLEREQREALKRS